MSIAAVQDFIVNRDGVATGNSQLATLIGGVRNDIGLLRPYEGEDHHRYVTINTGRTKRVEIRTKAGILKRVENRPIFEQVRVKDLVDSGVALPSVVTNGITLRREEWAMWDRETIPPQRTELRLYNDMAAVDTLTFNGLGVKQIEHYTESESGKAYMDMDFTSEDTNDIPLLQPEGQPVPVVHSGFTIDLRSLESSRRTGTPLNTRLVANATRRCMELVEDNAIGIAGSPMLGGASTVVNAAYTNTPGVYGLLNYPDRMTKTDLTVPTGSNPEAIITDILEMRDQMYAAQFKGPYGLYVSTDYDAFLDQDYARLGGDNASMTLRDRILRIGGEERNGGGSGTGQIKFIRRLDRLTPAANHAFTMVMVALSGKVVRALNGMPVTIFQWETQGGAKIHFRVACIKLLEFFSDYYGNCGLLHARTP